MDLYLRIAPELYLKRLVVGGFERVFEINRNFRNEGVSTSTTRVHHAGVLPGVCHHTDLMDLTENLLARVAETITGSATVTCQGRPSSWRAHGVG